MKIRGKQKIINYIDVDVEINDIIDIVKDSMSFGNNYVNNGIYYTYTGDNHHNGDPEYDERPAMIGEIEAYKALQLVVDALLKRYKK